MSKQIIAKNLTLLEAVGRIFINLDNISEADEVFILHKNLPNYTIVVNPTTSNVTAIRQYSNATNRLKGKNIKVNNYAITHEFIVVSEKDLPDGSVMLESISIIELLVLCENDETIRNMWKINEALFSIQTSSLNK